MITFMLHGTEAVRISDPERMATYIDAQGNQTSSYATSIVAKSGETTVEIVLFAEKPIKLVYEP